MLALQLHKGLAQHVCLSALWPLSSRHNNTSNCLQAPSSQARSQT